MQRELTKNGPVHARPYAFSLLLASLCLGGQSQAGLDAASQGAEVADALQLVVRQLDAEVVFEARQQVERLEAVNAELLEEIIVRGELFPRHLEMLRRQIEDFVGRLF